MANEMDIEELEVSVRTGGVLQELGVKTVGELLAVPEIAGTPASIAELKLVFEELGVTYGGEFVSTGGEATVRLEGGVADRIKTIEDWLRQRHPEAVAEFRPPATDEQITAAEAALGLALPDDFRQFLRIHNGQEANSAMVMTCSLVPVEELAELRSSYAEVFDEPNQAVDADEVHPAIKPVEHNDKWIPIGRSARGRDYLCIDLDPSDKGTVGQIILTAVDFDGHDCLAPSFTEFLSVYFDELQTGEIELDDD